MKTLCPHCNSRNTRQHSDCRIYEEHMIAETSYRCNRCKKYFLRRFQLINPEYKFHRFLIWNSNYPYYQPDNNEPRYIVNPKRDDPPDSNTNRYGI